MKRQAFPTNCSITLHTDFGNTSSAIDSKKYTPEEVTHYLTVTSVWDKLSMITLNEEQDKAIGKAVRKAGFKCIKVTKINGNHGMKIKIFFRERLIYDNTR